MYSQIQDMLYIIVLLFVSLMAFGLARQSITYPNEDWHWLLIRNVFYKPYFMLYGEVYAGEIDLCGDTGQFACIFFLNFSTGILLLQSFILKIDVFFVGLIWTFSCIHNNLKLMLQWKVKVWIELFAHQWKLEFKQDEILSLGYSYIWRNITHRPLQQYCRRLVYF